MLARGEHILVIYGGYFHPNWAVMAVLVLDDLDIRLTAALQLDGRASAEKIAGALGVPTRVVARRLRRCCAAARCE